MPVKGTLYTYPDNFRAFKALIAAKYSGAEVKIADKFVFGETNKSADFLAKFPFGKVPAYEDSTGLCLFESNAIAYHLANEELRGGKDLVQQALVQQWISFADSEILPAACTWVFPVLGVMHGNKQSTDRARDELTKALKTLNDHLLHSTYLVGERITLADIAVCCTLLMPYKHVLDPHSRKGFTNVNRWFNTLINQPSVKAVIGEVKLCDKAAHAGGGHREHKKSTSREHKKSTGDKKAHNKNEKKPQQEKKKKEAEEDPMDDILQPEEKKKDPLDLLPKGKFDLDDFKRFYSNNEEEKSVPYFWEKFDKENYSIWRGDYKYNDELTMVFMSCNLIGGMFQRLEKMRKNAFASCCLFGENNNSSISGIWVWRGQDLAFELSEDWKIDYSSYQWTKLDPDSDETKKMVEDYFKWQGTDKEGRKFNQGKIFK